MGKISDYYCVKGQTEYSFVIEHSKFICYLNSFSREEEIKCFIEKIKKQNSLATHNCYAYICGENGQNQKFSDDGEPNGTAGMPILEILKKKRLYNTVAVVTRYFGGIKLGTGGLSRAYSNSVMGAVDSAKILNMAYSITFNLHTDYNGYSKINKYLCGDNCSIISTDFTNGVDVFIAVKYDFFDGLINKITNALNGDINITKKQEKYYAF